MMRRRLTVVLVTLAAALGIAAPAWADSCANVSRPAPAGYTPGTVYQSVLMQGNWVWLPSLTAVFGQNAQFPPLWGFITPGTSDAQLLGSPGAAGNYTNLQTVSLLGVSALCSPTQAYVVRQTSHGIQSGCASQ